MSSSESEEALLQRVVELSFENHYFHSLLLEHHHDHHQDQAELPPNNDNDNLEVAIAELKTKLEEERQTRTAAEEALQHLRDSSDSLLQERDAKYADLDSKFTRLHKRAKQRIQDVQKEKDDLESQLRDANQQLSSLQQELERTRQQASESFKAVDLERQQLRTLNNKLRDNIEELRHSLEPKQQALEALRESLLDKDQMLENMRGLLQASEEKRQASIVELTAKHQKHLESLEMQLAEAMSERNKATETISSLQVLVAEKESLIAEMDAASSGEEARLKAAIESVKGELVHQKLEHDKEKEKWEATCQAIKTKLETAESNCIHAEIEAAKTRSQLELQLSTQTKLLNDRDVELAASREQISRLEAEFSSYKFRAHSLLQKKDAELAAVNDSEQVRCLEEALKDVETELSLVSSERDKAVEELQHALASCEKVQKELFARDAAREVTDKLIRDLEMKLDSQNVQYQSDKDAWESKLRYLEEKWQDKYEALKAETEAFHAPDLQKELEELKLQYGRLKEEHDSFRELADSMMEDKDKDISRLLNENKKLQHSLKLKLKGVGDDTQSRALQTQDTSGTSIAEQQILMLARQQAQREEELSQSQRHILALQEEIEELERENRLHNQQVSMLKEELRSMDRARKREGVDMTYLKNVVLKLLETGEVEALLPVVAMLLQFSPDEIQKCQQAYRNYTEMPPSSTNDASSRSLFSRFSFV